MSVELQAVPSSGREPPTSDRGIDLSADQEERPGPVVHELPPTDRGVQAWRFLMASFMIEAVLWGSFSFLPGHDDG